MKNRTQILIVDDELNIREGLSAYLEDSGYTALAASSGDEALAMIKRAKPDIVLTDLRMPGMDGLELLRRILAEAPGTAVMVLTAYGTVETAVKAMKAGAFHYLTKPVNFDELDLAIKKVLNQKRLETENQELRKALKTREDDEEIIGTSAVIQNLIAEVKHVASLNASVLLEGESGTGKELFARLIHRASPRAGKPFVVLHCVALAEALLPSELFGHEKGAFTGASERKIGRFERANGGTLFLDEISELKEDTQVKLLRVLQDGNFERVGGSGPIHVDIRLVCATNKNLAEEVRAGRFREDLYYRIHVVHFLLPPLRDRKDDIGLLADHFLRVYGGRERGKAFRFSPDAMNVLAAYHWPGNIRELRNVVERTVALAKRNIIRAEDLPGELFAKPLRPRAAPPEGAGDLKSVERDLIAERMSQFKGNKSRAARSLGISRRTLYRKMAEYKLGEC